MIAGLFFTYALVALLLVVNALRPPTPPTHRLPPLWLVGMIASEAAGLWLLVLPAVTLVAALGGALDSPVGTLGLVLAVLAWIGQLEVWRRSRLGARRIAKAVSRSAPRLWVPYPTRRVPPDIRRTVERLALHPHRPGWLEMDIYTHAGAGSPTPLMIFVHGGGWRGGHRRQTSQPILWHVARRGWTVAAIDYPLSPAATFPDHLLGIDAVLEWAGEHPGLDGPIVVMGASAGAHLAAVAALTRPAIDGLVGLYGIYDFLNRHRTRVDWPLIPKVVMKATPDADPEAYRRASPLDLVHAQAPPTLLVVGTFDSLTPPQESRFFASAFEEEGVDVTLVEVPWAQHAFDTMAGPRTRATAGVVAEWLQSLDASTPIGDRSSETATRD